HCIPIDPHYLSWKLKTLNYHARFIELADEINSHMPDYVVDKVTAALNEKKKPVNGSRVLVLGLAYKKNVSDCRESPAIDIVEHLRKLGGDVHWCDPFAKGVFPSGEAVPEVQFDAKTLASFDCVVVATDHDLFDPAVLVENAQLIVDARNLTKNFDAPDKIRRI
ncbi:MAG: UDP-N-acetyl-D-glucosamine dehydrogenase, partial [Planctomycetes bacterium]|nr:UDP-N-acetyl-D-glucosamine dehydrogenase [Planctomycetota bacterium]